MIHFKLDIIINLFNSNKKRLSKKTLVQIIVVFLTLATAIINLLNSLM